MSKIFIFSSLLISACASLGPAYEPTPRAPNEQARLYVYRVSHFAGGAGSPEILLDGKSIGDVSNGSYFASPLVVGTHKIEGSGLSYSLGDVSFTAEKGRDYFLRVDMSANNGAKQSAGAAAEGAGSGAASVAAGGFFANDAEVRELFEHLDTRAQKRAANPGFFFVKQDFAQMEMSQTRLHKK